MASIDNSKWENLALGAFDLNAAAPARARVIDLSNTFSAQVEIPSLDFDLHAPQASVA